MDTIDEHCEALIGRTALALSAHLPRDVQEMIFETAVEGHEALRHDLAVFLHERHPAHGASAEAEGPYYLAGPGQGARRTGRRTRKCGSRQDRQQSHLRGSPGHGCATRRSHAAPSR